MSDEPHLPGYKLDDDPTSEPESPDDAVLVASSAGAADAVRPAATTTPAVSSQSPQSPTQSTPVPQSQQQQADERTNATANTTTTISGTAATPSLSERTAVDEFADPKIASLHAIFPDYDATLL